MTKRKSVSQRTTPDSQLFVTSHVGRDFLQCASTFQTEKRVIWEYVANSIQYVDPGVTARVEVTIDTAGNRIAISDNGRGMPWSGPGGLQEFFVMHGENADRRIGKDGRGRFGTGKSAAFGIANTLRISTVRNRRRCVVQLHRGDIEAMRSGDPIPIRTICKDEASDDRNGTTIEIEDVQLERFDIAGTRRFIERHLRHMPAKPDVRVNRRICEWQEPACVRTRVFTPGAKIKAVLGDIELVVKIAKAPLPTESRGIAIASSGVWMETTLAGAEGREMSQYIFGYTDVPKLDADDSSISPFDMTRRCTLNPSNRLVQQIYSFCGRHIEAVRRELVTEERQRRLREESHLLKHEASQIQQLLNDDFRCWRYGPARNASTVTRDWRDTGSAVSPKRPGVRMRPAAGRESAARGEFALKPTTARPPSSFRVRFRSDGVDSYRAYYDSSRRAIYINSDHPQIAAARSMDDSEKSLRRLAYEAAFAEYAIALQEERAERGDYIDLADILGEAREVIDRLGRRCALLYEQP